MSLCAAAYESIYWAALNPIYSAKHANTALIGPLKCKRILRLNCRYKYVQNNGKTYQVMPRNLRVALNPIFTHILLLHMLSVWNVHHIISVEYSHEKNMMSGYCCICQGCGSLIFVTSVEYLCEKVKRLVDYPEALVPLLVRIELCKQAFIGCCSSFDMIARTEYSLKLFLSIFKLLNVH